MKITSRVAIATALLLALVVVSTVVASSHALYLKSVPPANSTDYYSAPSTVRVIFSEEVNPKGTALTVAGPGGAADKGDGHVDQSDPNRQTMLVSLKAGLPSGKYTVSWTTVSADDGDAASGTFVFTVAAPVATPAPTLNSTPATLPQTGGAPVVAVVVAGALLALVGSGVRRLASRGDGRPS